MRKESFEIEEFYHVYNRGVDKRGIFKEERDRIRFIHTIFVANNFIRIPDNFNLLTLEPYAFLTPQKPLVNIAAGCLMPTHYHLLLSPRNPNAVSNFLHKVGTSYTKYFNGKYQRTGRLFENTFKAKHVDKHEYALYLTQYIHLNPSELTSGEKRPTHVSYAQLQKYQWSSLPDYIGKSSKFSLILSGSFRDTVLDMNAKEYETFLHTAYIDTIAATATTEA